MNDEYSARLEEGAPYELTDAFLEGEPIPLASFALHDPEQRRGFLREFCRIGEPRIFEAVSHIWSSLTEPQEDRCTVMGVVAGTGGTGKKALLRLLRACLEEVLEWDHPLPRPEECVSLDEWHAEAMAAFAAEAAREEGIFAYYADILDGRVAVPSSLHQTATVIAGPWLKSFSDEQT